MNRLDQVQPMRPVYKDGQHEMLQVTTRTKQNLENTASSLSANSKNDKIRHTTQKHPTVGFGTIQFREFDRIVGDHPDVLSGGPPISIGWTFVEGEKMDINAYEERKKDELSNGHDSTGRLRLPGVCRLSSGKRRDLLRINFGVPLEEILEAEAEVERIKKQREQTNRQRKVFARTEEIMQSAKRKLNRTFSREMPFTTTPIAASYRAHIEVKRRHTAAMAGWPLVIPGANPPNFLGKMAREISV